MLDIKLSHPTERPNFAEVEIGELTIWFSYKTVIALHHHALGGLVVRANQWGNTTGRAMGWLEKEYGRAKTERVPEDEFLAIMARFSVSVQ